jgi:outer membrane protein TolC
LEVAERSAKAGMANKLEITDRTINVEEFKNKISQTEYEMANILVDFSFYTGKSYRVEPLKVSDLSFDAGRLRAMNFKRHPEYQYYLSQHKKAEEEYKIVKRQFLPKFDFYARYSFYGSDKDDYFRSYGEIRERSYSLGLYTSIPFTQNLKRRETLSRIKMEREKTKMQMDGVLDSIHSEYDKLSGQYAFFLKDIEQKKHILQLTRQKTVMLERLMLAKAIELKPALEQKLSLIDRELELERQIVERQVAIKHIMIRVEGAV